MKSLIWLFTLPALIISSCASQKGTKDDYFGYNNSPTINEHVDKPILKPKRSAPATDTSVTLSDAPQSEWVNPMTQDDDSQVDYQDDATQQVTTVGYHPYSSPQYVPVVVPWWDSYSGWMGGYYSRPVVVVRYPNWYWGWNSYCDWYSPYYNYHPWYGGYFSHYQPRYYGWDHNYWRPWHNYPIYNYGHANPTPRKPNSVRSWGPTRGDTPISSGGVRGTSTNPTPVSTTPAVRNERGQNSGSSQANPTNSNSTPGSTIRNDRGNSSATPQQSGNQHPLRRNETTPSVNNPKPSATSPSEVPVRHERSTKEPAPLPRFESKSPSSTTTPRHERTSQSSAASPTPSRSSTPSASPSSNSSNSSRGTRKP